MMVQALAKTGPERAFKARILRFGGVMEDARPCVNDQELHSSTCGGRSREALQ